jgi:hypothetical protein
MKKKINIRSSLLMFIGFLIVCGITIENPIVLQVEAAESIPQVSIVSLDHSPFVEGDKNEFYIASKNYTGKVQYQLFYNCETTMGNKWQLINNSDMLNGWTGSINSQEPIKVDISNLKLSADYYRFAIRVRRVGIKGKFSNSYGDYDSVYPFAMDVLKAKDINLNGDMLINKNGFTQKETLKIQGTSTDTSNVQYKLHLYDIKNDKWITNLTDYRDTIEYPLSKLQAGTYIVDIWGKNKDSNNKYDGFKLSVINVKNETIPKVNIVSLEHYPFVEKDNNELFIASKDYSEKVQYQLFYTSEGIMNGKWELINNDDMVDGWTKPTYAQEPIKVNLSKLSLKAEFYRFAIRVRRVGVEGKYKNQYGSYDDAYPFNVSVTNNADINFAGNLLVDKTDYAKNDQLKINGIEGTGENTQYKLHLYDTVNNKWLTDLTEYSDKIDYDLSNIPEGTYILDVWVRNSSLTQKYDGWKLKIIHVTTDLIKISSSEDINAKVKRNTRYIMPREITTTLQDGNKVSKAVVWNKEADTRKAGVGELEGRVLGYDKPVKLTLEVEETYGNESGNILNMGLLAKKDGMIYYSEGSDGGKLYRADLKANDFRKICDDEAYFINVVGEYVYYANELDGGRIYRIKLDGTNRSKLTDKGFFNVIVEDDYIYATDTDNFNIYKISTDGKVVKKLGSDAAMNLNVTQDYLYYNDINDLKIYRINKNGSGRTKIYNESAGYINVVGDWIFYINFTDNFKIYKIKTDGTTKTKISDLSAAYLNVANNGRIYFLDLGTKHMQMIEDYGNGYSGSLMNRGYFPNVIDEYVYYLRESVDWFYRSENWDPQNSKFGLFIKSAGEVNVTVLQGTQYSLPGRVKITTIANSEDNENVIWNVPEIDTSQTGKYTFEGTILGYSKKVIANVNIVDIDTMANFKDITVKVNEYRSLPSSIYTSVSSDSSTSQYIAWDKDYILETEPGVVYYKGAVGSNNKIQVKVTVIGLASCENPQDKKVLINEKATLPSSVKATYEDGTSSFVEVVWDKASILESQIGEFIYEGTVKGYKEKIKQKIIVQEVVSLNYEDVNKTVIKDYVVGLPAILVGSLNDGTERNFSVQWSYADGRIYNGNLDTTKVGEYFFEGKVLGYSKTLKYNLKVYVNENIPTGDIIAKDGEWIFYKNVYDKNQVYRIKEDGSEKKRITDDLQNSASYINGEKVLYLKGYLYYVGYNGDERVYRINGDGTGKTLLATSKIHSHYIRTDGTWIYLIGDFEIKKVKMDGIQLNEVLVRDYMYQTHNLTAYGEYLFYYTNSYSTTSGVKAIKKLTGANTDIYYNADSANFQIVDGWIYYIKDSKLIKEKIGFNDKYIYSGIELNSDKSQNIMEVDAANNYIYYINKNGNPSRVNIDGSNNTLLGEGKVIMKNIKVLDGWIYSDFTDYTSKTWLYRMKVDGTGYEIVA